MVDFKKRLGKAVVEKPLAPTDIYDRLDRASDKGPLRPAQRYVLDAWHSERRADRDVILKLHTGQGKTLIGLLILQSKLNEADSRGLYLCPNNFLVQQTLVQAKQFGIAAVGPDDDGAIPSSFFDGKAIMVAPVQKLFNGLTKFGLGASSTAVQNIVLDDAHACIDAIKSACMIRLGADHPAYAPIVDLFSADLEDQGVGTFADIRNGNYGAFLPVPYWAWFGRYADVAGLLAKHSASKTLKFTWPILKDALRDCLCVVSGAELVIAPYLPPLDMFGSYSGAAHRVFMSATVTDDSFLVKGLGLQQATICNPLLYPDETWSGEKMILLPSLIDQTLTDQEIVSMFGKPRDRWPFGVVVLTPSFDASQDWASEGAVVAEGKSIETRVEELRAGDFAHTLVIANRYDGIDLPDETCRILVLDGKPFGEPLLDRYWESCRPGSEIIATRTARIIEQGLGRAVRGEKDYCAILMTGADLVKAVGTLEGRAHFSEQTRTQITLGLEISEYARDDVAKGVAPRTALRALIKQCLNRDEGWKEFYVERMNAVRRVEAIPKMVDIFEAERRAEAAHRLGNTEQAVQAIQALLDGGRLTAESDRGWYLQEIARYQYSRDKVASNRTQLSAHAKNRYLLRPREGMKISKLAPLSQKRVAAIVEWIGGHWTYDNLTVSVEAILEHLRFGVRAEHFEAAIDDLARALGFRGERPDKEWKAGPDNLWALRDGEYLLLECKSEVDRTREAIHRDETGQMNNASAWFAREYSGAHATRVLIIPTRKLSPGAGFNDRVLILRERGLRRLTKNVRQFFTSFRELDLRDLDEAKMQVLLDANQLRIEDLAGYAESPRHG